MTAPAAEDTTMTVSDNEVALAFPNNAVTDLLAAYEKLRSITLIKDTTIFDGATVSLSTPKPVSKDEAIKLIEATLMINGYAIVADPDGKSARIMPTRISGSDKMQFSQGVQFYTDPNKIPDGETLVTYFMKLQHLTPEEAGTILSGHIGLNVYGRMTPVTTPPGLLITESAPIVKQLIGIQETIDSVETTTSLVTKFIKLKYADASTVAQIINATLEAQAKEKETKGISTVRGQAGPERRSGDRGSSGSSNSPAPTNTVRETVIYKNSGDSNNDKQNLPMPSSQVVADARLRQLLVVATVEDYAYITSLIEGLDLPVEVAEPYERRLNYVFSVDVLPALADLLKDPASTTQLPGGGTLAGNTQQVQASSTSQVLGGRTNTRTSRGAQLAGSTGGGATTDAAGNSTTTGGVGSTRADMLTPPQEDNAPISLLVGKTRLVADPQSNTIFVMGDQEAIDKVSGFLDKLDRRPAQVYLSTVIGQLSLGDGYEMGVDYLTEFNRAGNNAGFTASSLFGKNNIGTSNIITDVRDNLITTPFGPGAGFNVYGQIAQGLDAFVTALQSADRFKVLSRPSVFALNNKKATITSGSQVPVPYQTITNASGANANGNVTTTVDFKDVVLKLEVVPLINANNEVTLTIAQINDTITGTQRVEPNNIPIIGTEQLVTTVTVPDGQTIVLGGLISETSTKSDNGVPGVSRIPLLGHLFRNSKRDLKRKELLIFIQPHVVSEDNSLRRWSSNEDKRTEIAADAANRFPTEATDMTPTIEDDKKPNWFQRNFTAPRGDGSQRAVKLDPLKPGGAP
jgi:general secretion pathway protein D